MLGPSLRVKKKIKYPLPGDAASILTGGNMYEVDIWYFLSSVYMHVLTYRSRHAVKK